MKRRLFASIVALAMVLTLLPVSVLAEEGAPQAVTVAKIGDTEYASLAEAVEAVSADASTTITMHENHTLSGALTIPAGKNIVLDLNGKTITYNSTTQSEAMITNMGTLTINDSASAQSGVINYNYTGAADPSYRKGNYTISNSGTLTVNGGKITIANLRAHAKYPINNDSAVGDAVLVINGGHLYNYNTSAIRQLCNSTTHKNSVTINGGLIEGFSAIWMQNPGRNTVHGSLSITGGEIRSTAAAYVSGSSALKDVASHLYFTIDGAGGAWSEDSAANFSGGIFNENVDVGDNAPAVTIGTEAVFNGRIDPFVARIGNVIYETLADAVAAVPANTATTITVLKSHELSDTLTIPADKTVTLDLNGKTIDAAYVQDSDTNHIYAITNNGTLSITGNGTINARGNFNYGTMTLENGIINAIDGNGGYGVRSYSGATFTMNGGTVATTFEDGDEPEAGYDATPVRVDGGATFTMNGGTITNICNYTFAIDNYGTTTINGGTITSIHSTVSNEGDVTINGGSFTCNGLEGVTAHALVVWEGSKTIINGGTFDGKDNYNGFNVDADDGAQVTINGGNFLPVHSGSLYGGGTIEVSGGTFFDDPSARLAPGYIVTESNGSYTVAPISYTITFDTAGGSAIAPITQPHGSAVTPPANPTRSGYTFTGWSPAIPSEMPAEDLTVTAQWQKVSSSSSSDSSSVPSGTVTPPPSSPSTPTPTLPDVTVPDAPKVDTSSPTVDTKTETTVDGSSVKTETKEDGTVVESVTKPDGASSTTATKTEVKENADGSTSTTTATNTSTTTADGSKVTEEKVEQKVENKDGSMTTTAATKTETTTAAGDKVTEEKVAETTENADGSFTFTVAAKTETTTADGKKETVVSEEKTTANADGSATKTTTVATQTEKKSETTVKEEKTVVNEDGTTTTTETAKTETALDNGSKGTTTVDETGKVEAKVEVTNKAVSEAAKSGETVALPMPEVPAAKSTESAPSVSINMPASTGTVKVEVPVENVGGGVVAVIVNADGSETVLTDTLPTENGISVPVEGNVEIKIVDKSVAFEDKSEVRTWAHKSMDFVSARGIMNGVGDGTAFAPNGTTTRAMVWTMLARLDGVETSGGRNWAAAGRNWAMENGISDGTNGDAEITREQLATMLYRFMGSPAHDHEINHFDDHHETSKWAREAKAWAVGNKVINGKAGDDGALTLDPTGDATRAEVSQMFMNFLVNVGMN